MSFTIKRKTLSRSAKEQITRRLEWRGITFDADGFLREVENLLAMFVNAHGTKDAGPATSAKRIRQDMNALEGALLSLSPEAAHRVRYAFHEATGQPYDAALLSNLLRATQAAAASYKPPRRRPVNHKQTMFVLCMADRFRRYIGEPTESQDGAFNEVLCEVLHDATDLHADALRATIRSALAVHADMKSDR